MDTSGLGLEEQAQVLLTARWDEAPVENDTTTDVELDEDIEALQKTASDMLKDIAYYRRLLGYPQRQIGSELTVEPKRLKSILKRLMEKKQKHLSALRKDGYSGPSMREWSALLHSFGEEISNSQKKRRPLGKQQKRKNAN